MTSRFPIASLLQPYLFCKFKKYIFHFDIHLVIIYPPTTYTLISAAGARCQTWKGSPYFRDGSEIAVIMGNGKLWAAPLKIGAVHISKEKFKLSGDVTDVVL
jgi:hypothetical protein